MWTAISQLTTNIARPIHRREERIQKSREQAEELVILKYGMQLSKVRTWNKGSANTCFV